MVTEGVAGRYPRTVHVRLRTIAALLGIVALPLVARAQVDCSNPDNLCTGDPCIIPALEVDTPCIVDFGARTVVIAGRLAVAGDDVLSFTAGSVLVQATISNVQGGIRPDVVLTATGDVTIAAPVRLSGTFPGRVRISAGGALDVTRPIILSGKYAGEEIALHADGNVTIEASLRSTCRIGIPAPVSASAGGVLTVDGSVRLRTSSVVGGVATFSGDAGVVILRPVSVRHQDGAGSVTIDSAAGDIDVAGPILASAGPDRTGGTVTMTAAGNITLSAPVFVGPAGELTADAGGAFTADSDVRVGSVGTVTVNAGSVQVSSSALLHAEKSTTTNGGGEIRLTADTADMVLSGVFLARDGGVIEGSAAGNLVADGIFRAAPNGCIGLSAGGTLDTSSGSFDESVVASCP